LSPQKGDHPLSHDDNFARTSVCRWLPQKPTASQVEAARNHEKGGLFSDLPTPGWTCLKRLSGLHQFNIIQSHSRQNSKDSVIVNVSKFSDLHWLVTVISRQQWPDYVCLQMEHKQIEKCNNKMCVKTAINDLKLIMRLMTAVVTTVYVYITQHQSIMVCGVWVCCTNYLFISVLSVESYQC